MLNLYRSSSLRGPSDKEISQPAGHVLHVRDRFWGHTNTNTPNSVFQPPYHLSTRPCAMCLMGCIQPGRTFTPCLLHRDDPPFTARERDADGDVWVWHSFPAVHMRGHAAHHWLLLMLSTTHVSKVSRRHTLRDHTLQVSIYKHTSCKSQVLNPNCMGGEIEWPQ